MISTITVNQWAIKRNAEKEKEAGRKLSASEVEPVLCVHTYTGRSADGVWGRLVLGPKHYHSLDNLEGDMIYDPVNKTPCGASCWMQVAGLVA